MSGRLRLRAWARPSAGECVIYPVGGRRNCIIMPVMFTPTKWIYIAGAALFGAAAGGYVAWAIAMRFVRIAELNERAIIEPHILVVLCTAGGLLAFPLGAAAGLVLVAVALRLREALRRARVPETEGDGQSWVTRSQSPDEAGTD